MLAIRSLYRSESARGTGLGSANGIPRLCPATNRFFIGGVVSQPDERVSNSACMGRRCRCPVRGHAVHRGSENHAALRVAGSAAERDHWNSDHAARQYAIR